MKVHGNAMAMSWILTVRHDKPMADPRLVMEKFMVRHDRPIVGHDVP